MGLHRGRILAAATSVLLLASCRARSAGHAKASPAVHANQPALPNPPVRLSDFEAGLGSVFKTSWQAMDDKAAGGVSTANIALAPRGSGASGNCLRVTGNSKVETFPFAFAGVALPLGRVVNGQPTPIDLGRYHGISFWVKGDGKKYMLRLESGAISDFDYHHYVFTAGAEWTQVRVPFDKLEQFSWGTRVPWTTASKEVSALLVVTYSNPGESVGSFTFEIDDVSFF